MAPYSRGKPQKTSARTSSDEGAVRPVIGSNGVPFSQMRSVGSHSTSGREKARAGWTLPDSKDHPFNTIQLLVTPTMKLNLSCRPFHHCCLNLLILPPGPDKIPSNRSQQFHVERFGHLQYSHVTTRDNDNASMISLQVWGKSFR